MTDSREDEAMPVMTVTYDMVMAGVTMMTAALDSGLDDETMISGVFMAMMTEHEGGFIAFQGEGEKEIHRMIMGAAH